MKERLIELLDKKQVCGWKYVVDDYTTDVFNEDIADYLLENGVVVVDTNKVSVENLPLITHIAGYPIDEVIEIMQAKAENRVIELPMKAAAWLITELTEHCRNRCFEEL